MSAELLYTSAPQGLRTGSRGFCTVASTSGMPINLATRLESLSAYRHVFSPNDPQAAMNPVNFSHLRTQVGGKQVSILSRIAAYGVDYSQRTNKIAHHIVLETSERPKCGPAALMQQPGFFFDRWDGECRTLATGPAIPNVETAPEVCRAWQRIKGDAGWGGVVAEALQQPAGRPLWIVFSFQHSSDLLQLIAESISILSPEQRWHATFTTYFTNLPPDVDCKVRFVLEGTNEARLAPAKGTVIKLNEPEQAATSRLVEVARTGISVEPAPPKVTTVHTNNPTQFDSPSAVASETDDPRTSRKSFDSDDQPFRLAPPVVSPKGKQSASRPKSRSAAPPAIAQRDQRSLFALAALSLAIMLISIAGLIVLFFWDADTSHKVADNTKKESQLSEREKEDNLLESNQVEGPAPVSRDWERNDSTASSESQTAEPPISQAKTDLPTEQIKEDASIGTVNGNTGNLTAKVEKSPVGFDSQSPSSIRVPVIGDVEIKGKLTNVGAQTTSAVTLEFGKETKTVKADKNGNWKTTLKSHDLTGVREITATIVDQGAAEPNTMRIHVEHEPVNVKFNIASYLENADIKFRVEFATELDDLTSFRLKNSEKFYAIVNRSLGSASNSDYSISGDYEKSRFSLNIILSTTSSDQAIQALSKELAKIAEGVNECIKEAKSLTILPIGAELKALIEQLLNMKDKDSSNNIVDNEKNQLIDDVIHNTRTLENDLNHLSAHIQKFANNRTHAEVFHHCLSKHEAEMKPLFQRVSATIERIRSNQFAQEQRNTLRFLKLGANGPADKSICEKVLDSLKNFESAQKKVFQIKEIKFDLPLELTLYKMIGESDGLRKSEQLEWRLETIQLFPFSGFTDKVSESAKPDTPSRPAKPQPPRAGVTSQS